MPDYNILLMGDQATGRDLINRYVDDAWTEGYIPHDSRVPRHAMLKMGQEDVKLTLCEAQETYRRADYTGAHAIIVSFDLTDEISFKNAQQCLANLKKDGHAVRDDVQIILAGTNSHIERPQIPSETIQAFMDTWNQENENSLYVIQDYYRTSAKDNENVSRLFNETAVKIHYRNAPLQAKTSGMTIPEDKQTTIAELTSGFRGISERYAVILGNRSSFFYGIDKCAPQRTRALTQLRATIDAFTVFDEPNKDEFFKRILRIRNETERDHRTGFLGSMHLTQSALVRQIDHEISQCLEKGVITAENLKHYQTQIDADDILGHSR